jgi:hypothetical protein
VISDYAVELEIRRLSLGALMRQGLIGGRDASERTPFLAFSWRRAGARARYPRQGLWWGTARRPHD